MAAGVARHAVPILAILSLPMLFAAGMCLMDTLDGAFMSQAYGWAFSNPMRKIYYNITVTSLSVVVALAIGTVELLQVASMEARAVRRRRGTPWTRSTSRRSATRSSPCSSSCGRGRSLSGRSAGSRTAGARWWPRSPVER